MIPDSPFLEFFKCFGNMNYEWINSGTSLSLSNQHKHVLRFTPPLVFPLIEDLIECIYF